MKPSTNNIIYIGAFLAAFLGTYFVAFKVTTPQKQEDIPQAVTVNRNKVTNASVILPNKDIFGQTYAPAELWVVFVGESTQPLRIFSREKDAVAYIQSKKNSISIGTLKHTNLEYFMYTLFKRSIEQ